MKENKILKYGIGIFILEIMVTGIWFYVVRPEPNTALEILRITIILFGINLILGLILYFLKKPSAVFFNKLHTVPYNILCLLDYVVYVFRGMI